MKAGWEEKKFSECFRLKSGDGLTSKAMNEGAYPVYGGNGIAGTHNKFNLSGDNVIIGRVGALCGNARHITENIWLTDNAFKIVDFKYDFGNDFLTYLLNHKKLRSLARQAAQPVISNSSLKDLTLCFPRCATEQQRIVVILDEAFAGIATATANAGKNLQNASELFESHLQSVFTDKGEGWVEKTLKDICTKITDGVHKKPDYVEAGIPFVKINNLTAGPGISFKNVSYITKEDHDLFCNRTNPEKGDILITKDGTIGVVRFIDTEIEFSIFVSVALIKPRNKGISNYLKYVLESPLIQDQIKPQGAALKHLYLRDLREYSIPIAPAPEQSKIVKKLDALSEEVQRLEAIYQKKLNDLVELKQSILQKAFAGELSIDS